MDADLKNKMETATVKATSALSAEDRRKLRRLKILSNMDNRLKKISDLPGGGDVELSTVLAPTMQVGEPLLEESPIIEIIHNHGDILESQEIDLESISTSATLVNESIWDSSSAEPPTETAASSKHQPENRIPQLASSKPVQVVLLAVFVMIMLRFQLGHLFNENVLVPFYTLELASLLVRRAEKPGGLVGLLTPLLGRMQPLLSAAAYSLSLASDITLYLFTVLCVNTLLVCHIPADNEAFQPT